MIFPDERSILDGAHNRTLQGNVDIGGALTVGGWSGLPVTTTVSKTGNTDFTCSDYVSDDACIQAAIDYVNGLGDKGKVLTREGTYSIDSPVVLYDHIHLCGVGESTILKAGTNLNDNIIENSQQSTGNTDITVSHLKIDGNSTNQSGICYGMWFNADSPTPNTNINLLNLIVADVRGTGIVVKGTEELQMDNINAYSNGVTADVLYHNIYLRRCINVNIANTFAKGSIAGKGCKITDCDYISVRMQAYDNSAEGIYFGSSRYFECLGVYDNNGASGIRVLKENTTEPAGWMINAISNNNTGQGVLCNATNGVIAGTYINNSEGIEITRDGKTLVSGVRARGNSGYGVKESGTANNNLITGCELNNNTSGGVLTIGTHTRAINNPGYNPVGAVGPPSVPATTVNYTNAYGYPCQVQVYSGTVSEIDIDDIATGLTAGVFIIPPGGTINITYTVAPSWRWWGL